LTYIELVVLTSNPATFIAIKDCWDWAGVLDTIASKDSKKDVWTSIPEFINPVKNLFLDNKSSTVNSECCKSSSNYW
jgi:hypothetical protein